MQPPHNVIHTALETVSSRSNQHVALPARTEHGDLTHYHFDCRRLEMAIAWFRFGDFRLTDNAALLAACGVSDTVDGSSKLCKATTPGNVPTGGRC